MNYNNIIEKNNIEKQYRRIQGLLGEKSFSLILPKSYAIRLGIGKGDFVEVILQKDHMVVKKA